MISVIHQLELAHFYPQVVVKYHLQMQILPGQRNSLFVSFATDNLPSLTIYSSTKERIQMNVPIPAICVEKRFEGKIIYEIIDTSIQKRNLSNVLNAAKVFANPVRWRCIKFCTWKNLRISALFVGEALIRGQTSKHIC